MPTTTVTTTRSSNVAVHTISFRGLAGAIFCCVAIALVLYVIGFATTSWWVSGAWDHGLWRSCKCGGWSGLSNNSTLAAVQAMITIGLICLIIAFILVCIYMCVHSVSKNSTILALVIVCFIGVLFMLIGFLIFGIKFSGFSWSFAITVIAAILTLVAGILAIVQMREAGVRV